MSSEVDNTSIKVAGELDPAKGGTSPTNWWRYGLVGLFIVAAMLLGLQLLNGQRSTDMIPGTPTVAPQTQSVS